jgi:hypothetical protein
MALIFLASLPRKQGLLDELPNAELFGLTYRILTSGTSETSGTKMPAPFKLSDFMLDLDEIHNLFHQSVTSSHVSTGQYPSSVTLGQFDEFALFQATTDRAFTPI